MKVYQGEKMRIQIYDRGDMSVGIYPTEIVIGTNIELEDISDNKEEMRKRFIEFFREEFDLIKPITCTFNNEL